MGEVRVANRTPPFQCRYEILSKASLEQHNRIVYNDSNRTDARERKVAAMTLQQLYYIIVISETGSLNKAAERLYVSQPSLSSAVKELEKEIGISIFNRTGKGVTLTADGMEFLPHAGRRAQAEVRRIDAALLVCGQGLCRNGQGLRRGAV